MPNTAIPDITSHQLRRLAEEIDGARGKDVLIVFRENKYQVVEKLNTGETAILTCETTDQTKKRPEIEKVEFKVKGKPGKDLKKLGFDSVFWSESAVEKFVLPYYARLHGPNSGTMINALLTDFNQEDVAGVVHLPKSDSEVTKELVPPAVWSGLSVEAQEDTDPIHLLSDIVEGGKFVPLTVKQYGEIAALVPAR
ncbi:MAG TPA: hypothetical protein VF615_21495 [Longimicrobiaceae bacterium]|jgi:hypothetical protein